jgi:hypothetical protein
VNNLDPPVRTSNGIVCLGWRPFQKNTLQGFAEISVPAWHLVIKEVEVHEHSNGKRWVALPSKPLCDEATGAPLRDDKGKIRYVNIFQLTDPDTADRFKAAVLQAVDRYGTP